MKYNTHFSSNKRWWDPLGVSKSWDLRTGLVSLFKKKKGGKRELFALSILWEHNTEDVIYEDEALTRHQIY
jgi:hypothetical protein